MPGKTINGRSPAAQRRHAERVAAHVPITVHPSARGARTWQRENNASRIHTIASAPRRTA